MGKLKTSELKEDLFRNRVKFISEIASLLLQTFTKCPQNSERIVGGLQSFACMLTLPLRRLQSHEKMEKCKWDRVTPEQTPQIEKLPWM